MTNNRIMDAVYLWLARRLPDRLVMWCTVVVGAHATTGIYKNQIVPELLFVDALKRWETK